MRYPVVLFDVDGTLLDTREHLYSAYAHTLRSHGYPVAPREAVWPTVGRPMAEAYRALVPAANPDLLLTTHWRFELENVRLAAPFPGIPQLLAGLVAAGARLAAITTRQTSARPMLESAGIAPYFTIVIDGDDVGRHKPDPEGILKAMSALDAAKDRAVIVGDATYDIEAGRRAGIATIAVTWGFHREAVRHARPSAVAATVPELAGLLLPG